MTEPTVDEETALRRDILRAFFAWLLLMAALSLAASALVGLAGFLLVRPNVQSIESLVLGLAVVSTLGAVASVAVSLIGSALMSLLILKLFHAHVAGAGDLPGGVYLVRLLAGPYAATGTLVVFPE